MPTSHEPIRLKQIDVDKLKSVATQGSADRPGGPGREAVRSLNQDNARIEMDRESLASVKGKFPTKKKRK